MDLNSKCEALRACVRALARSLGSAECSRETRLLDHCRETPLRLAAAPLACYFYCCDPGAINQPVVGPSARLLPSPHSPHFPSSPRPRLLQQHPRLTELIWRAYAREARRRERAHNHSCVFCKLLSRLRNNARFLYFLKQHMWLLRRLPRLETHRLI